jgi:hypothetical protein
MQLIPHHGNNKGSGFPLNLGADHKCNESTRELKDGGGLS